MWWGMWWGMWCGGGRLRGPHGWVGTVAPIQDDSMRREELQPPEYPHLHVDLVGRRGTTTRK